MRIRLIIAFLALAFLLSLECQAQSPAAGTGIPNSLNLSSTIAVTGTFQSIRGADNFRQGCEIQNNGSHTMYVYFGVCANATTAASANLTAGQPIGCSTAAGYVLKDQVCITGTAGDTYFANFQ
jgi:hypothetical protein